MSEQSWINDKLDRSKWPAGLWDGEPDKVQWKDAATGLDCLANRASHSGHWCGYVGVPPGHPLHGKDYDDVRFPGSEDEYPDVHGGLTYADACGHSDHPSRGICHIPAPGEPDGLWWFGFDCAHSGDWSPEDAVRERDRPEACWKNSWDARYRTLDYVKANCARLAAQINAAS